MKLGTFKMINFALQTARDAGRILAERFGRNIQITHKGEIDLVTEADFASEALIIERIQTYFPQHAILAEESGVTDARGSKGDAEYKWIIDPLDGTTNFAHAYPCFCVSIALEHPRELIIGVIYDPIRDEMFAAERGAGATLNGRRIRVSQIEDLNRALVCTGFPPSLKGREQFARQFLNFIANAQSVRRDGSAALDFCYVAMGRFDGFWEDGLHTWDVAAGALIIAEAGGKVTDFDGAPLDIYQPKVLISNEHIHDAMRHIIKNSD
ncbi:MAG: inositol monophosphatase family protein [Pyrinomonadaceae bacterium]